MVSLQAIESLASLTRRIFNNLSFSVTNLSNCRLICSADPLAVDLHLLDDHNEE